MNRISREKVLKLLPGEKWHIPAGKQWGRLQENPRTELPLTAHKEALLPTDLLPLFSQQQNAFTHPKLSKKKNIQ